MQTRDLSPYRVELDLGKRSAMQLKEELCTDMQFLLDDGDARAYTYLGVGIVYMWKLPQYDYETSGKGRVVIEVVEENKDVARTVLDEFVELLHGKRLVPPHIYSDRF